MKKYKTFTHNDVSFRNGITYYVLNGKVEVRVRQNISIDADDDFKTCLVYSMHDYWFTNFREKI